MSDSASEALRLLDDLESFAPPEEGTGSAQSHPTSQNEAEALAFLDEITQKSSAPTPRVVQLERPASRTGTPSLRKTTERVRVGTPSPSMSKPETPVQRQEQSAATSSMQGGGWGWGSVWSSASAAISQAKQVVDEQVKSLPQNEQAKKWREGVLEYAKNAQLDKLGNNFKQMGMSTLTDILNVVAPPIAEHEVIQVWLSHDMRGYDGVESLVYKSLAKVMEQVQGGDLVVNRGEESKPKDSAGGARDLNLTEGYDAAVKLSQANIEELVKSNVDQKKPQPSSTQTPITYSHIYLRVQPYTTPFDAPQIQADVVEKEQRSQLQFLLYLYDPEHKLVQVTTSQAIPSYWMDVWDEYNWVEDLMAEALRVGVEVIGQEYVVARMGWAKKPEDASATTKGKEKEESEEGSEEESEEEDDEED